MKKPRRVKTLLILGLLFCIVASHLPVVYTLFYHQLTHAPSAENGNLHLTEAFTGKRLVLDGEWEFYWNRLLVTDSQNGAAPDFLIRVPDYWSKYQMDGQYLPSGGFASYRLTLTGVNAANPVTVWIPDFGSAYRVFVDGLLTAESGVVSKNPAEVFTTTGSKLSGIQLAANREHEIVIEVATTRFSGLYMAPVMMDYDIAVQSKNVRHDVRLVLFGFALFSFFILIVGYFLSFRTARRSVWLPVIGFLVLLRIMLTTEFYSLWQNTIFFRLSYEAANPLLFFISFAFKYLLIFLIEELLGIAFSRREKTGFLVYYIALYLVYFFTPHAFYNRYLTVLLPICAFLIEIYAFFKVWRNRTQLKKYGLLVYWGTVITITGLIIDCYYINGNIYPDMSLLLVVFTVYMMILGLTSSIRVSDIARDYALSCARLASARAQIAMQASYYDALSAQINEVRAVRHDFHHIVNVLKSLAGEARYEELNLLLEEYAEKSNTEPLPVFCENVVVNSILGYYSLRLKELHIPFFCACCIPKALPVSDSDICIVLGNALENAMEACEKLSLSAERFITVEAKTISDQLLIKIKNTYDGKIIRMDDKYLSTKDQPYHGLGLQNIKKIVGEYGGYVKTDHDKTTFTMMVAFPCTAAACVSRAY